VRPVTHLFAAAAVLLAGAALAATGAGATSTAKVKTAVVSDHTGDAADNGVDLTRVTFGLAPGGQLRASITADDDFGPTDLRSRTGVPGSVCLELWTVSVAGSNPPDYLICVTANAGGDALRATIMKQRAGQLPQLVSAAALTRSSERNVTLHFGQSQIGRPAVIAFAVEATERGCAGHLSCVDSAPNAPATATLKLRAPAAATG
jgi:hypothetical protein